MKTKFLWNLTLFFAFIVQLTFAQEKTISGTVKDASGLPLPGTTILVKGTSAGTSSDFDGNYSVKATTGATISFSFVGYATKEVTVGASNVINITLSEDASELEEVVITGILGTKAQPRAQGYSSSTLDSKDLTQVTNSNPFENLSGKVAGLDITAPAQPGASPKVIIRGFSSITGSNQPLFIVDGTPINNYSGGPADPSNVNRSFDGGTGISDLDPNNIESMVVLKSAAATALYGSRAANGAILITTKKGKNNNKINVDFTTAVDFDQIARIPRLQNTFGQGWNGKGYSALPGSGLDGATNENGSWGPEFNGQVRPWGQIVDNSQQIKPYVALPNNLKDFYDIGNTYTNAARVSGGTENADFALGLTAINSDGIIPTDADAYKRKSFNINTGIKNDKFAARLSANYINRNQNAVNTGQGDAAGQGNTFMQEFIQIPRDISVLDLKDYKNNPFNTNDNFYTPYSQNPYWVINENSTNINVNRLFGNINLKYNFNPNLSAIWQFGADLEIAETKSHGAVVNYSPGSPQALLGTIPVVGGVTELNRINKQYDTYATLNHDGNISENVNISSSIGFTFNQRGRESLDVSVTNLDIPNFYEISNSASTPSVGQSSSMRRNIGVYATTTLGFVERYFLTLSGRNDWSSTLPTGANSYFYGSATGSAVIIDNTNTFVKLRGGVSQVGNDTGPYQTESTLVPGNATAYFGTIKMPFGGVNSFELNSLLGNKFLKPEITTEYEVGTEVKLFNSRVNLDLAYYIKNTQDLLLTQSLPRSTGYSQITGNYAAITNKGIELLLSLKPIQNTNFSWDLDYTFTKNNNEVTDLVGTDQFEINSSYSIYLYAIKGKPLGVFKFKGPATTSDGKYIVDPTGYYKQSTEDLEYGDIQRKFVMGLKNTFRYKDFSLSFSWDWKEGGKMYSYTNRLLAFVGNSTQTTYNNRNPFIIPNSVVENPDGTYSENTTPIGYEKYTTFWNPSNNPAIEYTHIIDKTFIRLRDLTFTYTAPNHMAKSMGLSRASISFYGKNLYLWTPAGNPYVDPEVSTFGNDLDSEFGEFAANPSQRTYGISLKLSL